MRKLYLITISILFWTFFCLWTLFVTIPIILYTILIGWLVDKNAIFQHFICKIWANGCVFVNPLWKIDVYGKEYFNKNEHYVVVSNHCSQVDIILLYELKRQFKWLAKDSLFKIPFMGWSMAFAGYVPLKRGSLSSVKSSFERCSQWLSRGISVMVFPEGTRSETGKLKPFHNGAFKLAMKSNCKVLPMVMTGSKDVLNKGSWIFGNESYARIFVLPPVDPKNYSPDNVEEMKTDIRDMMAAKLTEVG